MTANKEQRLQGTGNTTKESGVALALCLVLLLVVTILGVTSLQTSQLEEGMARNMQDSVDAFQAAETGAVRAVAAAESFDTDDDHNTNEVTVDLGDGKQAIYTRRWLGETDPVPLNGTAFSNSVVFHHFEVRSDGKANNNARNTVYRGGIRIGPASHQTE